jgi:hypothetical protein
LPSGGALRLVEFEGGPEGRDRCRDAEKVAHGGWTRRRPMRFIGWPSAGGYAAAFLRPWQFCQGERASHRRNRG